MNSLLTLLYLWKLNKHCTIFTLKIQYMLVLYFACVALCRCENTLLFMDRAPTDLVLEKSDGLFTSSLASA